jgi:hypothetical protein
VSTEGDDAFDRRGPHSGEERHRPSRGSRGGRNRFRQTEGQAALQTPAPAFDSAPSAALEEEFAGSEADYSTSPPSDNALSYEQTTADIELTAEQSPIAEAQKHETAGQATGGASAERIVDAFATAEADVASGPPASAPSTTEPARPRRSGWWQRARASVIGK